jgi:ribosomal protein S27AE
VDPGSVGFVLFKVSAIAFSLLIAAYPFYRVVSMWLDKTLESQEAILYLGVLLLLLLGIISSWGTPIGWLLLLSLVVGCCGLPLLNRLADKAALRKMEDADIQRFSATLKQQPKNVYYRERLARIFLGRRQYDLALAQLDLALETTPQDRNLTRLRERVETEQRRTVERLKVCPKCGQESHADSAACAHCGFLFMDPSDILRLLWTKPALEATKWSGVGLLLAGTVLAIVGASPFLAATVMFFGIVCIFWYGYVHLTRL